MAEDRVKISIEAVDKFSDTIDKLKKSVSSLGEIKLGKTAVDNINKELTDLQNKLNNLGTSNKQLDNIKALESEIEKLIKRYSGLYDLLKKADALEAKPQVSAKKRNLSALYGKEIHNDIDPEVAFAKRRDKFVASDVGVSFDFSSIDKEIKKLKDKVKKEFEKDAVRVDVAPKVKNTAQTKKEAEVKDKVTAPRVEVKAEVDKSSVKKAVNDIQKEVGSKHIKVQVDPIADFSKAFAGFKDKLASLYAQKDAIDDLSKTPVRHRVGRLKDELAQFTISDMDRLGANDLNNRFRELKKKLELAEKAVDSALRTASPFNVSKKPKTELREALAEQIQKNGDIFLQNIEKFKDKLGGEKSEVSKPIQVTVDKTSVNKALDEIQKEVNAKPIKAKVEVDQSVKTSKQEKPKPTETKTKKTTKEPKIVDEIKEQAVPTQKVKVGVDNESIAKAKKQIQKKLDSEPTVAKVTEAKTQKSEEQKVPKGKEIPLEAKISKITIDEKFSKSPSVLPIVTLEGAIKKILASKEALDAASKIVVGLTANIDSKTLSSSIKNTINNINSNPVELKVTAKIDNGALEEKIVKIKGLISPISIDKEALSKIQEKAVKLSGVIGDVKAGGDKKPSSSKIEPSIEDEMKTKHATLVQKRADALYNLDKYWQDSGGNTKSKAFNDRLYNFFDAHDALVDFQRNTGIGNFKGMINDLERRLVNIDPNDVYAKQLKNRLGALHTDQSNLDKIARETNPKLREADESARLKGLENSVKDLVRALQQQRSADKLTALRDLREDAAKPTNVQKFLDNLKNYRDMTGNTSSSFYRDMGVKLGIGENHPYYDAMKQLFKKDVDAFRAWSSKEGTKPQEQQNTSSTYKTLKNRVDDAIKDMEKAWSKANGNEKNIGFLNARKKYIDAQDKLVKFQGDSGIKSLDSIIRDLESRLSSYGANSKVRDVLQDRLDAVRNIRSKSPEGQALAAAEEQKKAASELRAAIRELRAFAKGGGQVQPKEVKPLLDSIKNAVNVKNPTVDNINSFMNNLKKFRDMTGNTSSTFYRKMGEQLGIGEEHPLFKTLKNAYQKDVDSRAVWNNRDDNSKKSTQPKSVNTTSKDEKEQLKTLQQQRNKAVVAMDRAYQQFGKDSDKFREAQDRYRERQKALQDFQLSAGVGGGIQGVINDLKKQYAAYENNKSVQDIIKSELTKAHERKNRIDAELKMTDPKEVQKAQQAYIDSLKTLAKTMEQLTKAHERAARQLEQESRNAAKQTVADLKADRADRRANLFGNMQAIAGFEKDIGKVNEFKQLLEEYRQAMNNTSPNFYTQMRRQLGIGKDNPYYDVLRQMHLQAREAEKEWNKSPNSSQTMKNAMAIRNQYQTLAAEAQKYARQAEMAWRNAGNRPSEQFDKFAVKYAQQMEKIMDFGRQLGSRGIGSDISVLSNLARSIDRNNPVYDRTIQRIRELREEQERLKRATETAAQAAARQRREQRLESSARNQNASDITTFGGAMAYLTHFVGRSSKGWGSFGEAVADFAVKLRSMGGTAAVAGTALAGIAGATSGLLATISIGASVFSTLFNATQTLGSLLMQIGQQIYAALRPGIELYKQQQSAIFSFTAALQSNGVLENGKGQRLNYMGAEGRNIARGLSTDLINRAILDAEMSAFSLRDLLSSLQGTLPILMQRGMSVEQAYQINKGVAGVAKMTQLSPNQILQETRDLAQGSITARTSQVANALGITNEDIAKYKGDADGLFDYLMEKFKNYSELLQEVEDTALGRYQQLEERWSSVSKNIVDGMLPQFKGLFETLIELTGQWRDKTGAYLDALTGRWYRYNEETGQTESLDKVDAEGNIVEKYIPKEAAFHLSEALEEVKSALIEILDYVAMTADGLVQWAEEAFGVTDPIQTVKDILIVIIDIFADIVVIIGDIIKGVMENQEIIFDTLKVLWRIGAFLVSMVGSIGVIAQAFGVVLGVIVDMREAILAAIKDAGKLATVIKKALSGDFAGASQELFSQSNFDKATDTLANNLKDRFYDLGSSWYSLGKFTAENVFSTPLDGINSIKDLSSSLERSKTKGKIYEALHRNDGKQTNKGDAKGNTAETVRGVPKEDSAKANKQAIKEAQKMLKEQLQALKEALKDKLSELKDILNKNKIAYDEGFMSIKDYFTEKARIETEEARLELEYAQQEKELLLKTPFENEYDRLKELHSVNRRISEYTRKLDGAVQGQKEVQQAIKRVNDEFKEFGAAFFPATNDLISRIEGIQFTINQPGDEVKLAPGEMEWTNDLYKILNKEGVKNETISELLRQVSKDYGGNAKLAALGLSVLAKESAGNPKARSDAGAVGLMQLMPATARGLGLHVGSDYDDRLNPVKNISAGLKYLYEQLLDFGGDIVKAVAAYNAGPPAVKKAGGVPNFRETKDYVKKVIPLYELLSNAIKGSDIQVDGRKVGSTFSNKLQEVLDGWYGTPYVFGGNGKNGVDCSGLIKQVFDTLGVNISRTVDTQWNDFAKKNALFYEASKLNIGDLVFMNNQNHIGIVSGFKGSEPLVTHSGSSKGVEQRPLSYFKSWAKIDGYGSFAKYAGMSIPSASIPGTAKQSRANTTEIGHEATSQYEQFKDNILDMIAESNSKLLNIYDKSFSQLNSKLARIADKYSKQLKKVELNMQEDPNIREQARLAVIRDQEKEKLDTEHSLTTRLLEYAKTIMNYWQDIGLTNMSLGNMSNPEYANKLGYLNKQSDYYTRDNGDPIRVATLINRMWKEAFTAENLGFTELAASIRVKVLDVMKAMENHVNQYIEKLNSYFSNYSAWLNATGTSSLQKEYGNKEIEARENQIKSRIYGNQINQLQPQLEAKIAEIEKNRLEYAQATSEAKKRELDSAYKLLEAQKLQLQNDIDNYKQKKLISDELGDTNIRLREVQQTAKNAFENGLLEFLTDGITQAESLGDALRNMAIGFLQEMQKVFAKQAVATIMNKLFPLRRKKDYGEDSRGDAKDAFGAGTDYEGRVAGLSDQYDGIYQLNDTSRSASLGLQELSQAAQQAANSLGMSLDEEPPAPDYEETFPEAAVEQIPTAVNAAATEIQTSGTNVSTALQTAIDKVVQELNRFAEAVQKVIDSLPQGNSGQHTSTPTSTPSISSFGGGMSHGAGFGGNFITNLFASDFVQFLGSAFALKTLFSGDTKEKLLSMLYLESQLIYQTLVAIKQLIAYSGSPESSGGSGGGGSSSSGSSGGSTTGGSGTNPITNLFGSNFVQTLGSIFAVYTLFKGDTKEKLLSMIFLELQLIYARLSTMVTGFGFSKGGIVKLATGGAVSSRGIISGPGTSTSDSIPAMLSDGEAIINAKAVKKLGTNFISAVNNGDFTKIRASLPHFAEGGVLGDAQQNTARGMTNFAKNIGTEVSTTNNMNIALVRDESEALEHFMRSPQGQRVLVDFSRGNGRIFSQFHN